MEEAEENTKIISFYDTNITGLLLKMAGWTNHKKIDVMSVVVYTEPEEGRFEGDLIFNWIK